MLIKLYNTLTRKKEIFHPLHKKWVGLYTCGPTVYDHVHIGNLRTNIFQDILKRTLLYAGYKVRHIMNLTDVDDKTIKGARASGKSLKEYTRFYEKVFKEDLKRLNLVFPTRFTRATDYIPDMVALISKLLKLGFAYEKNGSIYFSISKFRPYGKLARLDRKGMKIGVRIDADEYEKDKVQDFALWKAQKSGEPFWTTPFGRGHPGWHIECSVMSMKYLSETLDIHTGGVDLIFPHHENEIAQSEAATGKKFVNYWVHGEHLLVDGKKMSKSLNNFYTLRDIAAKNYNPLAFRYLILTSHYRSKLNFTWESLGAAENSLERLYAFVRNLREGLKPSSHYYRGRTSIVKKRFKEAIFNDLDTPKAIATMWELIHEYNKKPQSFDAKMVLLLLYDFDNVLGLGLKTIKAEKIPQKVLALARKRKIYRENKRWQEADKIRLQIYSLGYLVEDTTQGQKIRKQ